MALALLLLSEAMSPDMRMGSMEFHALVSRVRGEFLEMPGLALTAEQVQRFCGIEPAMCRLVLDMLLQEQFLRVTRDGRVTRWTSGALRRPAKAQLRAIHELPVYRAATRYRR